MIIFDILLGFVLIAVAYNGLLWVTGKAALARETARQLKLDNDQKEQDLAAANDSATKDHTPPQDEDQS